MGFKQLFPNNEADFKRPDAVEIYTDGSCISDGRPNAAGGWAYCIKSSHTEDVYDSGGAIGTTNNQMEMTAVLEALKAADPNMPTTVYSDSKYVIETLKGVFKIGKNRELWKQLKDQAARFTTIRYIWVKGHANNEYNNKVDYLANREATRRSRR